MTYVEGEAPWSEDEQFAERAKACKARVKIFGECGGEGDFEGQCDECNYDAMDGKGQPMNQRAIEAGARADALFDGRTWQAMPKSERQRYIERSRAHHAHLKAEGFVVVPVIPTDDMDLAGSREVDPTNPYPRDVAANIYTAMIRAAAQEPNDADK